ncbi:hypothetical protein [Salinivibrio costicola]|uniref:DUF3102 domain-containing protein n=1 Tax=Salinivibrio costicola TaxID=51367 RepID=A0ABX6K7I0_SALCS|nr:hypothetical protein [Salinivibrio costicola]QIR07482.1 hypothetical protein HBA18_13755 [Salinivibrio costicola]
MAYNTEQLSLQPAKPPHGFLQQLLTKGKVFPFTKANDTIALSLARETMSRQSVILKDEENMHKLQMAELTRMLAGVKLEQDEVPSSVKGDPIRELAFECHVIDYLATQRLADQERAALESNPNVATVPMTPLQEEALNKGTLLEEQYDYQLTEEQKQRWSMFSDEVDWEALEAFLSDHYNQLQGLDARIATRYKDFMHGIEQLSTDPAIMGIDNQDTDHLVYLLSLVSQYLVGVKHG